MNNMEKVAEMLGVKLGEKFRTGNGKQLYSIDSDLCWCYCPSKQSDLGVFIALLTGKYTIEKLPWKPQESDEYWMARKQGDVQSVFWCGCIGDYALYYAGNCFATREEALAHAPEVIEKLRRKYKE